MKYLSLTIPGADGDPVEITAPSRIPSGEQFSIGNIASTFIQVAMVVGILLALFYLIYGGFIWVQSGGKKEDLDKARRTILFSIFGIVIMALSLVIVNVVASAFGVKTAVNP